ncbi:hypothetical protein [Coleofasciculus sp. F4-SAH-05]|uniref:hypothetical protein n=1 Tax=Coleofasciculus sp. F4-SAH-05 TaxID=3069525 RepID=UPI00330345A6
MSFVLCHWSFVIGHLSLVICHSSFVIRHLLIRKSLPLLPDVACYVSTLLPIIPQS